jgi:hypothetical protein
MYLPMITTPSGRKSKKKVMPPLSGWLVDRAV